MQAPLIPQAEDRVLALRVADAAVTAWRELDAALSPIIGQRGVAALYQRSLYLTRIDYPWLAGVHQATVRAGEFAPLHTVLSQQTSATAAGACSALLATFRDLLTRLIGASLTEGLLPPIPPAPPPPHAAPDPSP